MCGDITLEKLREFDGRDPSKPLYLARPRSVAMSMTPAARPAWKRDTRADQPALAGLPWRCLRRHARLGLLRPGGPLQQVRWEVSR